MAQAGDQGFPLRYNEEIAAKPVQPPRLAILDANGPGGAVAPRIQPAIEPPLHSGKYAVHVGSYLLYDNVRKQQEELDSLGISYYTRDVLVRGIHYVRLCAGPYDKRSDANKAFALIQRFMGIRGGIITPIEPDPNAKPLRPITAATNASSAPQ
ncbi:SPOR domain-containing protein [Magnetofaba australis]|uniref:SPOR domain-containing protein n=1 Tax=Magnetofaba australis TaxID=1472297 RepID=UPI000A19B975|nr:SPOR domain-containing protein [Magnetofaba australis]